MYHGSRNPSPAHKQAVRKRSHSASSSSSGRDRVRRGRGSGSNVSEESDELGLPVELAAVEPAAASRRPEGASMPSEPTSMYNDSTVWVGNLPIVLRKDKNASRHIMYV